jgi:hypothetical protein
MRCEARARSGLLTGGENTDRSELGKGGGVVKLKVLIKDRLLSQISNKFPPNMFQRVDVESSSVTQISTS